MSQLNLFEPETLLPPVEYFPNFLNSEQADELFAACKQLNWQHNSIRMLGKWIKLPRLETMYGDKPYLYTYSGSVELKARTWTYELGELRDLLAAALRYRLEWRTLHKFQLVIGNYYRSGADHIGWHSDDESSMGQRPAIASISLGATRRFQLKPKKVKQPASEYELTHGSLILMQPGCQENWVHRVVKTSRPVGERINLTFRSHV